MFVEKFVNSSSRSRSSSSEGVLDRLLSWGTLRYLQSIREIQCLQYVQCTAQGHLTNAFQLPSASGVYYCHHLHKYDSVDIIHN